MAVQDIVPPKGDLGIALLLAYLLYTHYIITTLERDLYSPVNNSRIRIYCCDRWNPKMCLCQKLYLKASSKWQSSANIQTISLFQ